MTIPTPFGTLTPAYGRDYKSSAAFLKDWEANRDFILNSPTYTAYINKADTDRYGGSEFQIRWDKKTQTTMIRKDKDGNWKVF